MGFGTGRVRIPGMGILFDSVATFSTTDTTVTVDCKGHRKVRVLGITPLAAPNANDVLGVGGSTATDANGITTVDADGTITIERPASGTSALVIKVSMLGEG